MLIEKVRLNLKLKLIPTSCDWANKTWHHDIFLVCLLRPSTFWMSLVKLGLLSPKMSMLLDYVKWVGHFSCFYMEPMVLEIKYCPRFRCFWTVGSWLFSFLVFLWNLWYFKIFHGFFSMMFKCRHQVVTVMYWCPYIPQLILTTHISCIVYNIGWWIYLASHQILNVWCLIWKHNFDESDTRSDYMYI